MIKNKNKLLVLMLLIIIYFLLKYLVPYGNYIIYPITLLVTFLHEFWHSFFALISWWDVKSIQINSDWSWFATTAGGWRSLVLMWWYIWSAIFWNILLYIWFKKQKYSEKVIYFLAWLMIFTWIVWYNSILSSLILFIIAWVFIFLAKKSNYDSIILQFLWIATLLYIIEDFNIWPSSDLAKFSDIFIIIPQSVWMYLWLIIVIIITGLNLKYILKK
jgi:hypothetical protein